MNKLTLLIFLGIWSPALFSQHLQYPFPVKYVSLQVQQQQVKMAYMDEAAMKPNSDAVLLLHGKNFNGFYWKEVIRLLNSKGYRVIVPDQLGFGLSSKPNIHYSFHQLAANTKLLLDTLGISRVHVIGHSMGGMLATRFALMYPSTVSKLIYENPIGLEDYKTFVPYQTLETILKSEEKATFESLKKYQQTYYPQWKPEYDQYVTAQFNAMQIPSFKDAAWASALTYQMIYEQPVVYEFRNLTQPTLIIIGQEDRTVVGKNLLSKEAAAQHGNYPALGKWLQSQVKNSKLIELPGVGHIPHIQTPVEFITAVIEFLK